MTGRLTIAVPTALALGLSAAFIAVPFARPGMAQDAQAPAAQQAAPQQGQSQSQSRRTGAPGATGERDTVSAPARQLPADSVTQHTLELPGRSLKFMATAGSIPLRSSEGRLQAEVAFIAYSLTGGDAKTRPVTFAMNGGPGSSSAWVHIGGFGPWRLPMDGASVSPSAPPVLLPNAETWLDFTDLVFIDPVGTGFSRIARAQSEGTAPPPSSGSSSGRGGQGGESGGRNFYSVSGDVDSLADMIHQWLRKFGRLGSPKVLVGESYSGLRVPKIAHALQTSHGAGVHAVVAVSPVLDYSALRVSRNSPLAAVHLLPSIAAAAKEAKGETVSRANMAEVETYARGEYYLDLMKGPRDAAAVDRIVKRVASLSGLSEATVRNLGGRLDGTTYRREANRATGRTASPYDASVKGFDTDPTAAGSRSDDPFTSGLKGPVTAAMLDLYQSKLNWRVDATYHMSNMEVNRSWNWGNALSTLESISDLKSALALDANLHALVTHGFTDLVTPYFMNAILLDQVPNYGTPERLKLAVYPGGHMYYVREASRIAFREDIRKLLAAALASKGP